MTTLLDWQGTLATLDAAIPTKTGPARLLLTDARTAVAQRSSAYAAAWSPTVTLAAWQAERDANLSAWADYFAPFVDQVDRACRRTEGETLAQPVPPGMPPGFWHVLPAFPDVALPWALDELPGATAELTLLDSGAAPALRVVALEPGAWGNSVEVNVTVSGPTTTLAARRGTTRNPESYTLPIGTPPDLSASGLLGSVTWLGTSQPNALGWTALAGGARRYFDRLLARMERSLYLPARSGRMSSTTNPSERLKLGWEFHRTVRMVPLDAGGGDIVFAPVGPGAALPASTVLDTYTADDLLRREINAAARAITESA